MDKDGIKKKIISYYHSTEDYYDKLESVFSERAERAFRIGDIDLIECARDAGTVLDIGCGTGALLRHVKKQYPGKKCYGVDVSPIAISKARQLSQEAGYDIAFANADMEQACALPEDHFDCVFAHEVFEHFVHPDRVIRNIAKLLKKNGIVVIIAPNHFIRAPFAVQCRKIYDFARMILDKDYLSLTIIDPALDAVGGDSDAVYISNPWEMHRMLRMAGLMIIKKSNLKCRMIARKP